MSRWWMTSLVVSGCSSVAVEGRLLDGLTHEPIAGPFRIQAKATSAEAALSCQLVDGEVTPEGAFKIEGLCAGTGYVLATDRPELWLVDGNEVPDGGWGEAKDLVAFSVPKDPGLYKLAGGEVESIKTAADVDVHRVWKSDQTVRAPSSIPDVVVSVGPDDHVILVGKGATDDLKWFPLVSYTGKRFFGDQASSYSIDDWAIVGAKSVNDTTVEPMTAEFDAAKVIDKARGEQKARFVVGSALPSGRYAALRDDDRRMYLVDFGK